LEYYNKKDYDLAIADYETALRINPNDTVARGNLESARRILVGIYVQSARAHNDRYEYDLAIEASSQAIRLDPNNAAAYNVRGAAYYYKGRAVWDKTRKQGVAYIDLAIADFSQSIRIDPVFAMVYNNRWLAYPLKNDRRGDADLSAATRMGGLASVAVRY
jgi:tetratricopeptide (TPR) repeat protein